MYVRVNHESEPSLPSSERNVVVGRACIYDSRGRILLLRRSEHNSRNVGLWECPGGKLKHGETIEEALTRELQQETGIYADPISYFTKTSEYTISDGKYKGQLYQSHFAFIRIEEQPIYLQKEHSDYIWTSYNQAMDYELTEDTKMALSQLPYFLDLTDAHISQDELS